MLVEQIMTDGGIVERDKVAEAISRLKAFEPPEGYYLAFSGGKDSVVLKALADMSGVKYDAHYSLTTVDPPELVRFIKDKHPDVIIDRPKETMWQLIVRKRMPPTRRFRYCCAAFKEASGKGRVTLTGVRWDESVNRKNNRHLVDIGEKDGGITYNNDNSEARRTVEQCYRTQTTLVNPIIDWTTSEVWEFIHQYNIQYCELYDEGWERLGCIGCPMADAAKEFERWPKYKGMYIRAFEKMLKKRTEDGLPMPGNYTTAQECFDWWIGKTPPKKADGQTEMDFDA